MTLKVTGAGFGRTGTESMKRALEMLGVGPCYHMYEVTSDPVRYALWKDIYDGRVTPDIDALFEGYQATVDWPACTYWREFAAHFPQAKILLTVRSPESWYASMEKTILPALRDPKHSDTVGARVGAHVFKGRVGPKDRDHVIDVYTGHNAEVQSAFGPERLLVYQLGSGWEPLCTFLGAPVPDTEYPSGNDAAAFHARNAENTTLRNAAERNG